VVADGFFGLLSAAELEEGLAAGFLWGHAGAKIFIDGESEVRGYLVVQFAIEGVAAEERNGAVEELAESGHGQTSVVGEKP
jgi:hypothetical protein